MEIKGKIEKVGFLFGTFNMLKEDVPKSIAKEGWTDILPMGCTTEKFAKFEPYKVEREQYICTIMLIKTK